MVMNAADLIGPRNDMLTYIANDPASIVIRRDGANLAAQTVRIEPISSPGEAQSANITVANAAVRVVGGITLDIRRGDRFFVVGNKTMYTVTMVSPAKLIYALAYAEASERQ